MLEQIDLTKKISQKEYKKRMNLLEPELSRLQRVCKEKKIPVIIVFEGFGAAGRGYQIGKLIHAMDPRGFYVCSVGRETEEDRMHPFLWRYWTRTPAKGEIAIFDRSWYRRVLSDRYDGSVQKETLADSFRQINSFERMLTSDGTVIIKLFLCIDKKEQSRRFEKLQSSEATSWRVTEEDLKHNEHFKEYKQMNDEMLEQTDTAYAPWTLIESVDEEFATVKIYTAVIRMLRQAVKNADRMAAAVERQKKAKEKETADPMEAVNGLRDDGTDEGRAEERGTPAKKCGVAETVKMAETAEELDSAPAGSASGDVRRAEKAAESAEGQEQPSENSIFDDEADEVSGRDVSGDIDAAGLLSVTDEILRTSSLKKADLTLAMSKEEYKKQLAQLQARISELHGEFYRYRIPVVLGFEGWDAGGKGGAIKRLTETMDPRGYQVHPTASPNDIEKVHHYLWRFWKNIPKDGHIAIFDRTWYGRVMVERIEGFCREDEWRRAYEEINDMESQLYEHGTLIIKFWMQIDKDEQKRRFEERMDNPQKRWKITDEDWRNRAKWDQYERAVDEMLIRTSTTYAPWVIVEGNSKYYARIKVLRTVVDAMEDRLEKEKKKQSGKAQK